MSEELSERMDTLQAQVQEIEKGTKNKLSMILFAGDLDKILAALIVATGAAAMGSEVVLFFTFWGIGALRDPAKSVSGKNLMARMFGWMIPRGSAKLKLSKFHMAGMGTSMMKGLMKKKNTASVEQLLEMAGMLGIRVYICEMSMDLMGFQRDEMIDYPGLEYCGVAKFMEEAQGGRMQLFIS